MQYIQSPLNYTGGKYKLLPQLLPYFPKGIDTFVDLFCGGCNVGINVAANKVIFNDSNIHLIRLLRFFAQYPFEKIRDCVFEIISEYGLSQTSENGYKHYGCSSNQGVGSFNKPGYLKLRSTFNLNYKNKNTFLSNAILYVLVVYAFNNQFRFNSLGEFNLPVGKRDFNEKMQRKLENFCRKACHIAPTFSNAPYSNYDISRINKDDFVYIDPPYLIACASYNESSGWTEADEVQLLSFLEKLDAHSIRFALSNVLESKGKKNHILERWIETRKKHINVINLDYSYNNASYQIKNKHFETQEVLITNY